MCCALSLTARDPVFVALARKLLQSPVLSATESIYQPRSDTPNLERQPGPSYNPATTYINKMKAMSEDSIVLRVHTFFGNPLLLSFDPSWTVLDITKRVKGIETTHDTDNILLGRKESHLITLGLADAITNVDVLPLDSSGSFRGIDLWLLQHMIDGVQQFDRTQNAWVSVSSIHISRRHMMVAGGVLAGISIIGYIPESSADKDQLLGLLQSQAQKVHVLCSSNNDLYRIHQADSAVRVANEPYFQAFRDGEAVSFFTEKQLPSVLPTFCAWQVAKQEMIAEAALQFE